MFRKSLVRNFDFELANITVISETSFESGMSDDYAVPPDAVSHADTTLMDASLPSLFMRTSYADSPNKKVEPLEKVSNDDFNCDFKRFS
jgi:hypothetical protein